MSESLRSSGEESHSEWQWGAELAEQMARHSTLDANGETVYLGREVHESERAHVEESGFDKPGESPRGSTLDRYVSRDAYPQLEGESDVDYEARLRIIRDETYRDLEGDAVTDASKALNKAHADHVQGRASFDEMMGAVVELDRAMDDREYHTGITKRESLGIAKKFGHVAIVT